MNFLSSLPGYLTALVALLAVLVTIWPPMKNKIKLTWIAIFVFITLITAWTMYKSDDANSIKEQKNEAHHSQETQAQEKREKELLQSVAYLRGQNSAMAILLSNGNGNKTLEQDLITSFDKYSKAQYTKETKLSLKKRALALSNEILEFLNKIGNYKMPDDLPNETAKEWQEKQLKSYSDWSNNIMNVYYLKFAGRVVAIHEELSENGLHIEDFDLEYIHPVNPGMVKEIALQIGGLAQKLH